MSLMFALGKCRPAETAVSAGGISVKALGKDTQGTGAVFAVAAAPFRGACFHLHQITNGRQGFTAVSTGGSIFEASLATHTAAEPVELRRQEACHPAARQNAQGFGSGWLCFERDRGTCAFGRGFKK